MHMHLQFDLGWVCGCVGVSVGVGVFVWVCACVVNSQISVQITVIRSCDITCSHMHAPPISYVHELHTLVGWFCGIQECLKAA